MLVNMALFSNGVDETHTHTRFSKGVDKNVNICLCLTVVSVLNPVSHRSFTVVFLFFWLFVY